MEDTGKEVENSDLGSVLVKLIQKKRLCSHSLTHNHDLVSLGSSKMHSLTNWEGRRITQWLRTLPSLPESSCLIPSTPLVAYNCL